MAQGNTLAASVQAKKGRLYAVIQHKGTNGKARAVWRALGLPEGSNKAKVNKAYREVVFRYEIEAAEEVERMNRPPSEIPIFEYMSAWLERVSKDLQINTYRSYHSMIYGKIRRYFERRSELTIGALTGKDIDAFYNYLSENGAVSNTVVHYHAILRKAFQQAFKEEVIEANPFDRIERPKKSRFYGESYSSKELLALMNLAKDDPIYPAIMLAGGMGLRRSEALGVRWSRIDFKERYVLLDTKIVEYMKNGEKVIEPVEEMKNHSSRRTLPIPDQVFEMLLETRAKKEIYKKMFKGSYNRDYDDYVCVNQLGDLLKPSYVTDHFHILTQKLGLRRIRFHDLRHTFASVLLNNDVPLINVSRFLGHSDISTTANIYAHLDKSSKQSSADVMSGLLGGREDK